MKKNNDINLIGIIKNSVRIYFKNIFAWVMICFFVYTPMFVCDYLMPEQFQTPANVFNAVYSFNIFKMMIYFLPPILFNPLAIAVIACVIEQSLYNKTIDVSYVLDNSLLKWKDLVYSAVIYYSIVLFTSLLIIPAIYFSVSFYFYIPIIALSKYKGMKAMLISKLAIMGRWFKAAGLIFLSMILSTMISLFIERFLPIQAENLFITKIIFSLVCKFIDIFFEIVLIVWFLSTSVIKVDEKEVEI